MIRAIASLSAILALSVTTAVTTVSPADADGRQRPSHPVMMLGPGDANVNGIGDEAIIRRSKHGYIFIAGQQNTHLRVKYIEKLDSLRYRDTRTQRLTKIPPLCRREKVETGISAVCKIPSRFDQQKMFVQVWPRLGNDYVDGRTLPKRFRLWVLADAGRDVVYGGAGADFVNGAKDGDRVFGGPGNDFLRGGPGNNHLMGGSGNDKVR